MERIDVLKGIEQILVQKAYETGHISHRADGDWQKTNNGWVRVKGNPTQTASQAQEPTPVENVEYSEIVQQDFESVPKSVKDKMFTVAQQYKSEWAEDSDEDIRSMAEDDIEAISQMLWENADEETRNSWLDSDEEDLVETPDNNEDSSYSEYLSNQDAIESYVDELDFDPDITLDQTNREDVEAYLEDHDWDTNFQQYLEEQGFDVDSIDEDSDEYQNALNDFMNKAVTYLSDNWDYRTESDAQYEDYVKDDMESVINKYGDKTAEEALNSWMESYGFEDLSEDNRKDFIEQFNKRIQKSAVRDMRSTPATKNMGF